MQKHFICSTNFGTTFSSLLSRLGCSRFSAKTLDKLCKEIEEKAIAGMVVIGEDQASRSIALAGSGMSLPVLWAKGGTAKMLGVAKEVS